MTKKKTTKHDEPAPTPPNAPEFFELKDERIARVGSAEVTLLVCPTCGTAKTANRCEVCGHQEHDT